MKPYLSTVLFALSAFSAAESFPQQKAVIEPELLRPEHIAKWDLDGSATWTISDGKLILSKAGVPSGPIRRPAGLAILKSRPFRRVSIEADIRSESPVNNPHRDLNVVVGHQSPSRFYYIHLSATTDSVHNGIFLVNNANRRRIDNGKGKPQLTDSEWHHVRVERDGGSGRIAVYVDKQKKPVLEATDMTIPDGRAGVGSFDDTGEFRRIRVSGTIQQ